MIIRDRHPYLSTSTDVFCAEHKPPLLTLQAPPLARNLCQLVQNRL